MDQQDPRTDGAVPEKGRAASSKVTNGLVALSSAAILTVYAAGYFRTRTTTDRFALEAADARSILPVTSPAAPAAPQPVDAEPARDAPSADSPAPVSPSAAPPPPSDIAAPATSSNPIAQSTPAAPTELPAPEPSASPTADPSRADAGAQTTTTTTTTTATTEPPAPPPAPPAQRQGQFKDGTFSGWGYSRHGDIEAAVVIQDGRVVSAEITQCLTRYSCSVIDMLPAQVISRQNAFVDLISGATESATAYSNAIFRALVASRK